MERKDRKNLTKKLDIVFSKYIRKRDGKCLKCGRETSLQCAHISSRHNLSGRWAEDNCITLCYACHLHWVHQEPIEFVNWLKENYPLFYEGGQRAKRTTVKNLDLEALLVKFTKLSV